MGRGLVKGIVNDSAITTTIAIQPSARYLHLGLGRPVPLASVCCNNLQQGVPFTPVTVFHVAQGRVGYKST
jgi:hypothetical protein